MFCREMEMVVPSKSIQTNLPSMHTVCRMVLAEEEAEHETRQKVAV
jgi:hypothetical protein